MQSVLSTEQSSTQQSSIRLGVNIDHVATIRQARFTRYPSLIEAAQLAEDAGADGITIHIREDRRHVQVEDLVALREQNPKRYINLEMALDEQILEIALKHQPNACCIVPEKRRELTTEGGLDVLSNLAKVVEYSQELRNNGIDVSLFVAPDKKQIECIAKTVAGTIELHTGDYANQPLNSIAIQQAYNNLEETAELANQANLVVNVGHGLNCDNLPLILALPYLNELNIGHAIVARAIMVGMHQAVLELVQLVKGIKK